MTYLPSSSIFISPRMYQFLRLPAWQATPSHELPVIPDGRAFELTLLQWVTRNEFSAAKQSPLVFHKGSQIGARESVLCSGKIEVSVTDLRTTSRWRFRSPNCENLKALALESSPIETQLQRLDQ